MRWFISSLSQMTKHREAVVKVIRYLREHRGFDLIPFLMEEYPSPSGQPQEAYIDELDKCDGVILILGKEYGNVNQKYGISATHREFRRAVEKGKIIISFYYSNKDDYEPEELEFLSEVFKEAQSYPYNGTETDLELQVQRVIEIEYCGSLEQNIVQAERDGLNFIQENNIPSAAIFSGKIKAQISIGLELQNEMKYNTLWLDMIDRSSKHRICRDCFESRYDEGGKYFRSLGRLYENGEILLVTIDPFISFNQGGSPVYSSIIYPNFLQDKIAKFTRFAVSFSKTNKHIELNLILKSNESMQLNNHLNPAVIQIQVLTGSYVSHQSDNNIEKFSWQVNSSDEDNEVLSKTHNQLLRKIYRAFHYPEPELCEPFNMVIGK